MLALFASSAPRATAAPAASARLVDLLRGVVDRKLGIGHGSLNRTVRL
jgi:hypothetical protein